MEIVIISVGDKEAGEYKEDRNADMEFAEKTLYNGW
jgi:hypothetical protein